MYITIYVLSANDVRLIVSDEECKLRVADIIILDGNEYAVTKMEQINHPDYEFMEYKLYLSFVQKEEESHGLH